MQRTKSSLVNNRGQSLIVMIILIGLIGWGFFKMFGYLHAQSKPVEHAKVAQSEPASPQSAKAK